jgi:hypothetical protein
MMFSIVKCVPYSVSFFSNLEDVKRGRRCQAQGLLKCCLNEPGETHLSVFQGLWQRKRQKRAVAMMFRKLSVQQPHLSGCL